MKDLVLLVADKDAQFALKGGLDRPDSLGIRPINFEFRPHLGRDGGVRSSGVQVLARERSRFAHAILMLDYEGCGTSKPAAALEAELNDQVRATWGEQGMALVIEPEVDVWMWGSDNAVEEVIGWTSGERIREWIQKRGYKLGENGKPLRPKETFDALLRECRVPHSAALYERVARKISLVRCVDPSFNRLAIQLRRWFPRAS